MKTPGSAMSDLEQSFNSIMSRIAERERELHSTSVFAEIVRHMDFMEASSGKMIVALQNYRDNTPALCHPLPLTPGIIRDFRLWCQQAESENTHDADAQLINFIISTWPAKDLLIVFPEVEITAFSRKCRSLLMSHLAKNPSPDAERIPDETYPECWKQRCQGIMHIYTLTHDAADPADKNDDDTRVIRTTARGLSGRIAAGWTPELATELRFYLRLGLLEEVQQIAGPASGFPRQLDYLTALYDVLPHCPDAGLREKITVTFPAYQRETPLNHLKSALVSYARKKETLAL